MFKIGDRSIDVGSPPFLIGELSGNHRGDIGRAIALIEAAKASGADAVKLQTYTADTITIDHDGPGFTVAGGPWRGRRLYDLYREAHTPWDWHPALFERARSLGLIVFSSPFDASAIEFLETLGTPAYKIASFEVVDLALIARAAATGKPLVISTGMASLGEIERAVRTARESGAAEIALLHCVSGYPTPAEEANLRTIPHLAEAFDVPVGLSDHTLGTAVATAAVALGACIVEKHLTLDRRDGGPDAEFSLEPAEFAVLSDSCRTAWQSVGRVHYEVEASEAKLRELRRSLYIVRNTRAGELLTVENVRSIRPGFGLAPRHLPEVLGRRARIDLSRGTPLDWSMVD